MLHNKNYNNEKKKLMSDIVSLTSDAVEYFKSALLFWIRVQTLNCAMLNIKFVKSD